MRSVFRPDDPGVNAYRLMTSLVVPRPIAWISTVSADGVGNLAPHSFFSVACARPPILSFTSVGRKDTLRNVLDTGEFVVNVATLPLLELVNATSAGFDPETDEAHALGILTEPSEEVRPRRVADSPASLECRLHSTHDLGDSVLVLGDLVAVTVRDEVLVDGLPDFTLMQPVARLGRDQWGLPAETRSVTRPARPEDVAR